MAEKISFVHCKLGAKAAKYMTFYDKMVKDTIMVGEKMVAVILWRGTQTTLSVSIFYTLSPLSKLRLHTPHSAFTFHAPPLYSTLHTPHSASTLCQPAKKSVNSEKYGECYKAVMAPRLNNNDQIFSKIHFLQNDNNEFSNQKLASYNFSENSFMKNKVL